MNISSKKNGNKKNKRSSSLSKETVKKIKEKYLFLKMKKEINHLKGEISEKNILMNHLKNNSKIIKLRELDNKYSDTYHELVELKHKYKKIELMKNDYTNAKNKITFLFQQIDSYKKKIKSQKEQIEKLTLQQKNTLDKFINNEKQKNIEENKIKFLKSENDKLKILVKDLNEKNKNNIEQIELLQNIKEKNKKLLNDNKKLKQQIEKYIKEIELLKTMLISFKNEEDKKTKDQDEIFMTTTKIMKDEDKRSENLSDKNNEEKIKFEEDDNLKDNIIIDINEKDNKNNDNIDTDNKNATKNNYIINDKEKDDKEKEDKGNKEKENKEKEEALNRIIVSLSCIGQINDLKWLTNTVLFYPIKKTVYVGSQDKTIKIYRILNYNEFQNDNKTNFIFKNVGSLKGHNRDVTLIKALGDKIISAGNDFILKIWKDN